MLAHPFIHYFSYLRSLIPSFNECVEHFLKRMRIKAIRERTVLMRKEMGAVTLQILGKVELIKT